LIAEPVNQQLVINLPPSMASRRLEVIVLPANEQNVMPEVVMRNTPSPMLAGISLAMRFEPGRAEKRLHRAFRRMFGIRRITPAK
jgi:hypothetical protein